MTTQNIVTQVDFVILTVAPIVAFKELKLSHIKVFFSQLCHFKHIIEFSYGQRTSCATFPRTCFMEEKDVGISLDRNQLPISDIYIYYQFDLIVFFNYLQTL